MDRDDSRPIEYTLFFPAVALSLAVSAIGLGGFLVAGEVSGPGDLFALFYPLLAFPLSLIPFFSPKIGVIVFSIYVFGKWLFVFVMSLPLITLNPFGSIADIILISAAAFVWTGFGFSYWANRRQPDVDRGLMH